ncbi:Xylanase inhibitor, C-terminal [Sesbania bispinosa]|nr:Xylanase inhibitor, C-terminal [Sesbania bispinosa]
MRIGVGQPVQPFYMIPDTGSNVNWLQCEPCVRCYNQSDPIFDPSRSSSYAEVPCESKQCKELATESCRNHECEYEVMYGDGSTTHGILVTETVTLGNTGSVNRVPMGCGHANQGLFVGAAGIVGLGRGPLSFLYEANATSFSYCLVNRDSNKSSTLDFNSPVPSDSVRTQLVRNPKLDTFYYVGVTGMSVGGRKVPIPPSTFKIQPSGNGGIIVDSGTSITLLEVVAYEAVRNVFVALTQHLKRAKAFDPFDTCYDLSSQKMVTVPTVSFDMSDGQSWRLPVLGYMIPVDDKATFCFAFAPSWFPLSIIGNVQQQGTRVTFDLANSVVGFSPHNCG